MVVSMEDVRALLDPDEPDYDSAAGLGREALVHLKRLVLGDDIMLASKAAYAASLLPGGSDIVERAASSSDPVMRVAAAAAARHLPPEQADVVLRSLVEDADLGIRKVAQASQRERRRPRAAPPRAP